MNIKAQSQNLIPRSQQIRNWYRKYIGAVINKLKISATIIFHELSIKLISSRQKIAGFSVKDRLNRAIADERGDVPGWVLVVLMTTGLVTAIWTIAAPRLSEILKHSLDSMNSIG